jgi:hypothetical protein
VLRDERSGAEGAYEQGGLVNLNLACLDAVGVVAGLLLRADDLAGEEGELSKYSPGSPEDDYGPPLLRVQQEEPHGRQGEKGPKQ